MRRLGERYNALGWKDIGLRDQGGGKGGPGHLQFSEQRKQVRVQQMYAWGEARALEWHPVSAQKALLGSETETKELLGGTEKKSPQKALLDET